MLPDGRRRVVRHGHGPKRSIQTGFISAAGFSKTANLLNRLPKSTAPKVKSDPRNIHHAETRAGAQAAIDTFKKKYKVKYKPGTNRAGRLPDPGHRRAAGLPRLPRRAPGSSPHRPNPIESVFATLRRRTVRTRGALSQTTVKRTVFGRVQAASKSWRRLKGRNQLAKVIGGVKFTDGVAAGDTVKIDAA